MKPGAPLSVSAFGIDGDVVVAVVILTRATIAPYIYLFIFSKRITPYPKKTRRVARRRRRRHRREISKHAIRRTGRDGFCAETGAEHSSILGWFAALANVFLA